ncbi:molybdopterin-dependent oxidoreductase [Sphingomonas yunnanensis]|uniref:xanthine dehydrogenase family protein molybdopterin-binding subunit n=1 Tax=Sphingomonas yunnanensis TaxID=310400 RepID=UPI001CA61D79|nr:molybdopterin cofactor-binding domain-containing protein [Sphingomonas yunnanensis]MBY9064950.1 molybdopterin-dependent oxidoreductase [Sphingomonas yunnanensis]
MGENRPKWMEADLRRAKITGEKVFASDYRSDDLGWGEDCAHALVVRATCVTKKFKRLDLTKLSVENQPSKVITEETIRLANYDTSIGVMPPPRGATWTVTRQICLADTVPEFLSQPLAILIYDNFLTFRRAAQEIREDRGIVVYEDVRPQTLPANPTLDEILDDWRTLEVDTSLARQHYLWSAAPYPASSQYSNGPLTFNAGAWSRADPTDPVKESATATAIYADLALLKPDQLCVETTTYTQQVDPAFLEPESGLARFKDGTLTILAGTQSASGERRALSAFVKPGSDIKKVELWGADLGGGFGGRDMAPHLFQLAFAAIFAGKPVRLAYDRFEQFQAGLKRHGSAVHSLVSATKDGLLDRALMHIVFEGGAEINLSNPVMSLGSLHATSFYKFRQASVNGVVTRRAVPVVGSMRGFGIPQVNFNIETAVDKLAVLGLKDDPVAFRRRNILRHDPLPTSADNVLAGTPLKFHVANAEVCDLAARHPLWTGRDAARANAAKGGIYRGVGFAGCMQAYGTSADPQYAAVQLEFDGTVTVWSETVDMGQGARQSLAFVIEAAFHTRAQVQLGTAEPFAAFSALMLQNVQNVQNVPKKWGDRSSASASKTAFFHVHVVREALAALLRFRILPALRLITGSMLDDDAITAGWGEKGFVVGARTVALSEIAQHLEASGRERMVIAHGYFANGWSQARFVEGTVEHRSFADAIGFARDFLATPTLVDVFDRVFPDPAGPGKTPVPRSGYAAGAHLIAVEIDPTAGAIRVTDAVAFLDAGEPIIENVLDGQVEGGLQMGIAHALFEDLPRESGQDRYVNFDRYIMPRASDVSGIRLEQTRIPLPPGGALNANDAFIRHKGAGEVTMTTVAAAISNAVAHALGHHSADAWPNRLPIRYSDLKIARAPGA